MRIYWRGGRDLGETMKRMKRCCRDGGARGFERGGGESEMERYWTTGTIEQGGIDRDGGARGFWGFEGECKGLVRARGFCRICGRLLFFNCFLI